MRTVLLLSTLIVFGINNAYSEERIPIRSAANLTSATVEKYKVYEYTLKYMETYNNRYVFYDYSKIHKKTVLEELSNMHGEGIQLMRLMCWIIENDADLRTNLLTQWIRQLKYDNLLLKKEETTKILNALIDMDAIRTNELNNAYASLAKTKNYLVEEAELSYGRILSNQMLPFIDKHYPMQSVLYSGNKDLIKKAYFVNVGKRGRGINCDMPSYDNFVDLAMRVALKDILYNKK